MEYTLMNYRRTFHLSTAELKKCDLQDVLIDLEMLSLESEYMKSQEEKATKTQK